MNMLAMKLMTGTRLLDLDSWEDQVKTFPGVHAATDESPVRFEILKEGMKIGRHGPQGFTPRIMFPTMAGIRKSLKSLGKNPPQPKTEIPSETLAELEATLIELGCSSVGYTQVPERWIFQNKAILHTNAIVMTMEMDKVRIDTAPSLPSQHAVMEIYRDLGWIANKGADFLRQHGYSAHAGHPLMGLALYPPLAQLAGLGWLGASGLIVTPEHGPRVRLAAIFTSAENLPFANQNDHSWVTDFCQSCLVCVQKCPPQAILEEPILSNNGQFTYVINERCFPYFAEYHGCSVCIRVCPFNHLPYQHLKEQHHRKANGGQLTA